MIEIEILNSPDKEVIGKHSFFFNTITIGRSLKHHLSVIDSDLPEFYLTLTVVDDKIFVKSPLSKFYLYNKNQYSGTQEISCQAPLSLGQTYFQINEFSFNSEFSDLDLYVKEEEFLIKTPSPNILESLNSDLKSLIDNE